VLTAIQICEAHDRGVLVPWNSWRHEFFKSMRVLHGASEDIAKRKVETVEKLQGRMSAVAESALTALANAGELDRADYDVLIDVRAVCQNCGTDAPVSELIRQGGCGCASDPTSDDEV
jgi:hypothetical protein